MPVPTQQEVNDAVMTDALAGIEEARVGDESTKLMPLDDRLKAAATATAITAGTSGWGGVLRARVVPPGAQ